MYLCILYLKLNIYIYIICPSRSRVYAVKEATAYDRFASCGGIPRSRRSNFFTAGLIVLVFLDDCFRPGTSMSNGTVIGGPPTTNGLNPAKVATSSSVDAKYLSIYLSIYIYIYIYKFIYIYIYIYKFIYIYTHGII